VECVRLSQHFTALDKVILTFLVAGRRRVYLNTQVDDMGLNTDVYLPKGDSYRAVAADLDAHVTWMNDLNSRLPSGSKYFIELAHNGNGAVQFAVLKSADLEFKKPLGTGEDLWPVEFTNSSYHWNIECVMKDPLTRWLSENPRRDNFAHLSHTFTHLYFNNATYADANREIQYNLAWLAQTGIDKASMFSFGLIPPSITGMHNGDVIKAWMNNNITHVVGDNTRPVLVNQQNPHWPRITTIENNGYAGLVIIPRRSTSIYFNCYSPRCTTQEWINTSAGSGTFMNLLSQAREENSRYLFDLRHDPFMFHQANMRQHDMPVMTIGSQTGNMSLIMSWVETMMQEHTRLVDWPILSLKHDNIGKLYDNRMIRE